MREPSAIPPAIPAAAAVPTKAGIFAFWATVPTESPALPTADPMESPTPLSVCVTPLVDCREADEPDLVPRDLLWRDRFEPEERLAPVERLALDDGRALRVGALREEELPFARAFLVGPLRVGALRVAALRGELLLRAGELPLLRRALLARAGELPLRRDAPELLRDPVFVWAI
jgi:hypothetical protein